VRSFAIGRSRKSIRTSKLEGPPNTISIVVEEEEIRCLRKRSGEDDIAKIVSSGPGIRGSALMEAKVQETRQPERGD